MKKILIAFDSLDFSEGAFTFAQRLNELQPILLTGAFLPAYNYIPAWDYPGGATLLPLLEEDQNEKTAQNIKHFEDLCQKNGVAYRLHKESNFLALPELKKETRFADLLIIGSETFYSNVISTNMNTYLHEVLNSSECPVIVVPEKFQFPERNVLAYDGSKPSLYAIKQFAYLFPELCNNETLLVFADATDNTSIPDQSYVEELATQHFKNLTLFKLNINPRKYFEQWASEEKGAIVVCGSYGRSSFSQLFRKSFITEVIADHKLPVFIAHQ